MLSTQKNPKLFVARYPSTFTSNELEELFSKYGKIKDLLFKGHFAFIEFHNHRDAEDARERMNNKEIDGFNMVVNTAVEKGCKVSHLPRVCYNCGIPGHYARDCFKPKQETSHYAGRSVVRNHHSSRSRSPNRRFVNCYNCKKIGHVARDCREPNRFDDDKKGTRSRSPRRLAKCYNCNNYGHIARYCRDPPSQKGPDGRDRIFRDSPKRRIRRSSSLSESFKSRSRSIDDSRSRSRASSHNSKNQRGKYTKKIRKSSRKDYSNPKAVSSKSKSLSSQRGSGRREGYRYRKGSAQKFQKKSNHSRSDKDKGTKPLKGDRMYDNGSRSS